MKYYLVHTPTFFLLLLFVFLGSCNDANDIPVEEEKEIDSISVKNPFLDLNLPETPFDYENSNLPSYFTKNEFSSIYKNQYAAVQSDNTPENNKITNAGATLGRVLFYEKKLSKNGSVSCASCHIQQNGFSETMKFSSGFAGEQTRRHAMSLVNSRFYDSGRFFWDERATTLEEQVLMPFIDPVEMGLTMDEVIQIVKEQPYMLPLFTSAFGNNRVNETQIAKALAQFIRSLVSFNAKYDQGRLQVNSPLVDFPNFTKEENLGKQLFFSQNLNGPSCSSCHATEAFVAPLQTLGISGKNNGLDAFSESDTGIYESTQNENDKGKFKIPTLRNIEKNPPYMHDGRFGSLEQVLEHYSTGIQNHPNLDASLKDTEGKPIRYNFTEIEKKALVTFLRTLTDDEFLTAEKFGDPFK